METRHHFEPTPEEVQVLRKQAGRYLRNLREQAGLTQRELAAAVGFEYYTFISQLEGGRGRLPSGQYVAFSKALGVPLNEFVKTLVRYYDPITYYAMTEPDTASANSAKTEPAEPKAGAGPAEDTNIIDLVERIARLEAMIAKTK
jgi:transcriptional regulator with XRE-family HTH domain